MSETVFLPGDNVPVGKPRL